MSLWVCVNVCEGVCGRMCVDVCARVIVCERVGEWVWMCAIVCQCV